VTALRERPSISYAGFIVSRAIQISVPLDPHFTDFNCCEEAFSNYSDSVNKVIEV
jgi:hypothetical protein